jgi:hypothetical protein
MEYVYAANERRLRTKQTTAVDGLTVPMGQTLELTAATIMDVDSTDHVGNMLITQRRKKLLRIDDKSIKSGLAV